MPLQIIRQDITKMACDAIVNPSNVDLIPDGGTDAAIHSAAGEQLLAACRQIGGVEAGEAVITPAFHLPCRYVIHTAGPLWFGGHFGEREQLISCYRNALALALKHHCRSVAFPMIASGLYGYPKDLVLKEAIQAIGDFLFQHDMMVYLVVYDKEAYDLSEKLFADITAFIDDYYVFNHTDNGDEMAYLISRYGSAGAIVPTENEPVFKVEDGFSTRLMRWIDEKGMTDVACYKKANVSKQTWHKIVNDKEYKPNKKTAISFAIALELSLEETQELLASVGFTLSNSSKFDVIIMYCIQNRIYNVHEIDAVLFKHDLETLFSVF